MMRRSGSVRSVEGLEWLVDRVPGGREAIDRPLEPAAPRATVDPPEETRRTRSQARAHGETRTGRSNTSLPVEPPRKSATAQPRAQEQQHSFEPAHESARARRAAAAGDQGLAALVRAWKEQPGQPGGESAEPDLRAFPLELPDEAAPADTPQASRQRRRVDLSPDQAVAAEELLGLGDELGRVLVAELRRYGIELGT